MISAPAIGLVYFLAVGYLSLTPGHKKWSGISRSRMVKINYLCSFIFRISRRSFGALLRKTRSSGLP